MVVDVKVKSHPAWVCGLKLTCTPVWVLNGRHTLRGCVDWNSCQLPFFASRNSHTLRGCVDWNLQTGMTILFHLDVTPCVGVWIETREMVIFIRVCIVTPCVGVWIETALSSPKAIRILSHPAWVCGLKHCSKEKTFHELGVTPCVGVWIETQVSFLERKERWGHTLRGCVDWNRHLC